MRPLVRLLLLGSCVDRFCDYDYGLLKFAHSLTEVHDVRAWREIRVVFPGQTLQDLLDVFSKRHLKKSRRLNTAGLGETAAGSIYLGGSQRIRRPPARATTLVEPVAKSSRQGVSRSASKRLAHCGALRACSRSSWHSPEGRLRLAPRGRRSQRFRSRSVPPASTSDRSSPCTAPRRPAAFDVFSDERVCMSTGGSVRRRGSLSAPLGGPASGGGRCGGAHWAGTSR